MRVVTSEAYRGQCPFQEVDAGRVVPAWDAPIRVENIRAALRLDGGYAFAEPGVYGDEPILAVHDAAMLAWLDRAWEDWSRVGHARPYFPSTFALDRLMGSAGGPPRAPASVRPAGGYWCMDSSTGIVEGTTTAFRGAVDIALTAVDSVLDGAGVEYALCRPPGHHAGADYFGGYCFINNAAIAVRHAQARGATRVAVIDVDYHHGNGTQAIFYDDPSVLVANLHADPDFEFPWFTGRADERGSGPGTHANLNVPLPAGTTDDAYLAALEGALESVEGHRADLVVVSLGVDGYHGDPIGSFALTTEGFARIGGRVGELGAPLAILQEGGYAVGEIGDNVAAFLGGVRSARAAS